AFDAVVLADSSVHAGEELGLVKAVEVNFVGVAVVVVVAGEALADDIGFAGDGAERRNPIIVADHLVGHSARLDVAGPADDARDAKGALPIGVLLAAEGRHGAIGPGVHVGAVVARVNDDRVVGDAHVVERLKEFADRVVVLDHAVDVFAI